MVMGVKDTKEMALLLMMNIEMVWSGMTLQDLRAYPSCRLANSHIQTTRISYKSYLSYINILPPRIPSSRISPLVISTTALNLLSVSGDRFHKQYSELDIAWQSPDTPHLKFGGDRFFQLMFRYLRMVQTHFFYPHMV